MTEAVTRRSYGVTFPWLEPPLDKWSIVGMNHYAIKGQRRLFVAMVKDGHCIKSEGENEAVVFATLQTLARAHMQHGN